MSACPYLWDKVDGRIVQPVLVKIASITSPVNLPVGAIYSASKASDLLIDKGSTTGSGQERIDHESFSGTD